MVKVKDREFYLDGELKKRLDNVKYITHERNYDAVIIIDGLERVGKSTLGITCGYYIADGNFTQENIAADSDDAIKKIESLPDKSVLLIDEGSLVFNSRDSMKREQRKLIKILNVVGQKNMTFIIVLPSFFDLNKSIAIRRSRFLLHCYSDNKLRRGRFAYFSQDKKKLLYMVGKKNYESYAYPKLKKTERGRFVDFNPLGPEYLETKKKSLMSALHEEDRHSKRGIRAELWQDIIQNVEKFKSDKTFNDLTQEDKANMLNISRRTYVKYLKILRDEGVLAGNER